MAYNSQLPALLGSLVGTISTWNTRTNEFTKPMTIYSRQEVYIGRDAKKCQYVLNDPVISNKHLWIYTVIFDQDDPGEIEPLVYTQDISMNGSWWNGYRMRKGRSSYLLGDGDLLQLSDGVILKYNSVGGTQITGFTPVQALEMRSFADEYVLTRRKLGSGAYGQVYMAYKKSTGQQFACKIVNLLAVKHRLAREGEARHAKTYNKAISPKLRDSYVDFRFKDKLDRYHREAAILQNLQHPNIVGLEKVIRSNNTIYMFQDLLTAGDLFSYIQYKGGRLPDIEAAVILRQIVIALDFLHSRNIVHRDLKPDNILMTSRADGSRVVLTDFGCATAVDPISNRMSSIVGTFEFSAPEVIKQDKRGYTKAADLWSLGCLAAILLTGEPLFSDLPPNHDVQHRLQAIKRLKVRMERLKVGERAQDFVLRLLQHDASKRMDVKEALQHPWFTNPSHKADFEALYNRSIRDWKPRKSKEPLIVGLDFYTLPQDSQSSQESSVSKARSKTSFGTETFSQISPSAGEKGSEDEGSLFRLPSATLDELVLVQHKKAAGYFSKSVHNCGSFGPFLISSSLHQNEIQGKARVPSDIERVEDSYTTSQALSRPRSSDSLRMQAVVEAALSSAHSPNQDKTGHKRSRSDADEIDVKDEDEDEVYEEVRNPITGKRQQVIYGARV
ncbi:kinase-like domain-containing protein [Aspergillus unguis]